MLKKGFTFLDLFSGIGGFRIALEEHGGKCIGFSEIDKNAIETYKLNYDTSNEIEFGDISKINTNDIPYFNVLTAGFPCQSFSLAGKCLGFEDTRGTLFFEIVRILKDKQPDIFILENVSNLVNHDNKKTFGRIISLLAKTHNNMNLFVTEPDNLGYYVYTKILNSKDFGVPQNRKRIWIIGFKEITNFKFPNGNNYKKKTFGYIREDTKILYDDIICNTLCTIPYNLDKYNVRNTPSRIKMINNVKHLDNNSICNTLVTKQDRNHNGGLVSINHDNKKWYRYMTPLEMKRLQSFPDDFKLPGNKSLDYYTKLFGNSITVNIVREIMRYL